MTQNIKPTRKELRARVKELIPGCGKQALKLIERLIKPFLTNKVRYNAKYSDGEYFYELLYTSLTNGSAEGSSKMLNLDYEVPSPDQILRMYKFPVSKLNRIRDCMLDGITGFAKRNRAFRHAVDIAIDFYDDPYYGDINSLNVVGTKHKAGTSYAHSFACCDSVMQGERFCMGFLSRTMITEDVELVENLLRTALEHVSVRIAMLDREFFQVAVIKILMGKCLFFIIPATDTPEIKRLKHENRHKLPCVVDYTMTSSKGEQVSMKLALIEGVNKKGEKEIYGFVTNLDWEAEEVASHYGNRWGTETNNRKRNEFYAMTTSQDYGIRFLYYMLSVALHNIWVLLNMIVSILVYGIAAKPQIEVYMMKNRILKEIGC